jgi:hypothetical protein
MFVSETKGMQKRKQLTKLKKEDRTNECTHELKPETLKQNGWWLSQARLKLPEIRICPTPRIPTGRSRQYRGIQGHI